MSGSVFSYFALTKGNHVDKVQECSHAKNWDQMVEYLRVSDARDIVQCYFEDGWGKTLKFQWVPTIEAPGTPNGFITESPDFIWRSKRAPVIDTLFSFNSVVNFINLAIVPVTELCLTNIFCFGFGGLRQEKNDPVSEWLTFNTKGLTILTRTTICL